ncbi:MAG: trimethylamine methyltransferase family protein [Deltaproteobacteria bacterium]|nr:MAG: trimethylamine methyltransferase family protein [Deltaproteobacteria bacterium]
MSLKSKLAVISNEDMAWIHEASLKILEKTGVIFHSNEAVTVCKKSGARIDGKIVYFPRKIVRRALETAPETFRWRARNDSYSVNVGDENEKLLLQPNSGPVYIQDLDNGRRAATLEDFANIIRLCQASDIVSLVGAFPVDPSDVHPDKKHLHMMYEILKNTDKPLIGFETDGPIVRQLLDMVEMAVGPKGFLFENHCIGVAATPLSPLAYGTASCETIIEFAKHNQPIFFTAAIMAGLSGPISLIGTTTQQNSEILAGIVLAQLVNPGNPVVYSNGSTVANMKNGNFISGSPEMMLIHIAGMQMGLDYYQLPSRAMCGTTDSKIIDCQAGYETMQNLMGGVLSGAHMVFECLGVLDSIMTTSYEKVMIDLELLSRVMCIREGMDTSGKEQALKIIQEIGHQAKHITHPDTMAHFKERWLPELSDWETYDSWLEKGSKDVAARANKKFKEILKKAPQTLIDPEIDKALKDYMNQIESK